MTDISRLDQTIARDQTSQPLMWMVVSRALAGYSVRSGLTVTQRAAGANMSVDVAAGTYLLNNVPGTYAATTNVAVDAADGTNPRLDILYINSSGVLTIAKGTAAAISPPGETNYKKFEAPYPADLSGTAGVPLAIIHVGAGVSTITNANIWMIGSISELGYLEKLITDTVAKGAPRAQDTPDMTIYVAGFQAYINGALVSFAGGSTGTMTAPSANPRIDRVYLTDAGALAISTGAEDASPTAPALVANTVPICLVYHRVGSVHIDDADDGSNSYIYRDDRPLFGGVSTPSAILDTLGSTEHHILVRGAAAWDTALPARGASPYSRWQDDRWSMKAGDRDTLVSPTNGFEVWINGARYIKSTSSEYNLAAEATWDTISGTDYRIASNRAGVNFYIYACVPLSGDDPDVKISANSSGPSGYGAGTFRKIGGFHCVPANMTSLPAGHDFISHVQGDIHCGDGRSGSIWDLLHRPKGIAAPEGMTWCEEANVWVMIYLISGTGVNTASVNGGTITDNQNWMDFVDDCGAVGCRLPTDIEFQLFAAGSNEETNIAGSADPGTTGHHLDTAGRSMISNCGCFDCCGVMWQWLSDQSFRIDGLTDPTVDPAWSWEDLPGSKGSLYKQGTYGDSKLRAGGGWADGSHCGSRCRFAGRCRWNAGSNVGARAVVESA